MSENGIIFKEPFGFSEFDVLRMAEARRVDYRRDAESVYAGRAPSVAGFWVSREGQHR